MENDEKNPGKEKITAHGIDEPANENLTSTFKNFIQSLFKFINEITNIKDGTDFKGTVDGIKKDIDFKGPGVWILIISILIASIGLNVNSTAVIIGAMLISPLMGPILGIGLSVGTNDWQTLTRSLKSFGIMVFVSLATSSFYFLITPLHEMQPELIARTKPTILDVMIAICGGMAGIIAGSRKEKSNVISGVAIATALMPPLCTAGFGLASGNWNFFFGAFYLFLLNSVFIAVSTVLVVRFLRFPVVQFINPENEKRAKKYTVFFVLIVMIPSAYIFWDVITESLFRQRAEKFIIENIDFEGSEIINQKINFTDSTKSIELFVIGEYLSEQIVKNLNAQLDNYKLGDAQLKIYQSRDPSSDIAGKLSQQVKSGILEELYEKNAEMLANKNMQIEFLEDQLVRYKKDSIPFVSLRNEIKVQYDELEKFAYSKAIISDIKSSKIDTLPYIIVKWKHNMGMAETKKQEEKLSKWLKIRLNLDTIGVIRY